MSEPRPSSSSVFSRRGCCNAYGVHKKTARERLSQVASNDLPQRFQNFVGQFMCDNCLKKARAEAKTEFESGSQSSSSASEPVSQGLNLDPEVVKAECSDHLKNLGLSPLLATARTNIGKAQYAKRKLDDVTDLLRKRICLALDIDCDDVRKVETTSKPIDADLMAILSAVKSKLSSANRREKVRLLTLCPLSWTIEQGHKFFEVSRYYVRTARGIRNQYGVFGEMPHVMGWKLPESTKQLVLDFYNDDEYSRVMPGKKDSISIALGIHMQKRLLLLNLKELYELFKQKYRHLDLKIGFSTFCALRPKWCVIAGTSGTHNVCVCIHHQNCKLKLKALGIKDHLKDLIPILVCSFESRECMLGLCAKCPTVEKIAHILREKVKRNISSQHEIEETEDPFEEEDPSDDFYFDDTIKYKEWAKTDGSDLVSRVCKFGELIDLSANALKKLVPHHFISIEQAAFLRRYKEEMTKEQAAVLMDFSMNYSCIMQDASQSYHWSKRGVTVHPVVIYYKNVNNELKNENLCFISEDLVHDVSMVRLIQEKTIAFMKKKLPQVNEVMYVSDGCAAQYKNCQSFLNLCQHFKLYGIRASWCFFATSHGKSPCDGIGGTVKREAMKASLQRIYGDHIKDANTLFKFCSENLSKTITFFQLFASDLKEERQKATAEKAVTIPGTRGFHHFTPISETEIECKRVSSNTDPSLVHALCCFDPSNLQASHGEFVAVLVEAKVYIGMVTDINDDEREVDLTLLQPSLPSANFYWPSEESYYVAPYPHVLSTVDLKPKSPLEYELPVAEILKLKQRAAARLQSFKRKS